MQKVGRADAESVLSHVLTISSIHGKDCISSASSQPDPQLVADVMSLVIDAFVAQASSSSRLRMSTPSAGAIVHEPD